MARQLNNGFITDDNGRKIIGVKNPDGSDNEFHVPESLDYTPFNSYKKKILEVVDGELLFGGRKDTTYGINAWDLFYDYLKGNTNYIADLATFKTKGIKLIRVSAGPNVAADWTSYIGATGSAPSATYLTKLQDFLNECTKNDVRVLLVLYWSYTVIPTVVSGSVADYDTPASAVRVYCDDFAKAIATNFKLHPALAGYQIGNEWTNYAMAQKFLSLTSNPLLDHKGGCIRASDSIYSAIRTIDPKRMIAPALGHVSWYISYLSGGGELTEYLQTLIEYVGACDAIPLHYYPDLWNDENNAHAYTGENYDCGDIFLNALVYEAKKVKKPIYIEECLAHFDNPPKSLTTTVFDQSKNAGINICLDWGWYADPLDVGLPNLKTTRAAVMDVIYNRNLTVIDTATPDIITMDYKPRIGTYFNGTGASNNNLRIANTTAFQPSTTGSIFIMLWVKKGTGLSSGNRVFACNNANGGYFLNVPPATDDLLFNIWAGGAFRAITSTNTAKRYPNQWEHYAIYWDYTKHQIHLWVGGIYRYRENLTASQAYGETDRSLYIGANSDGSTSTKVAISDFMFAKDVTPACRDVANYLISGTIPSYMQHRYKLDGNALDSIGTLHGILGAGATFSSIEAG